MSPSSPIQSSFDPLAAQGVRRAVRVRAVVPCFNRPGDLAALLRDFADLELVCAAGPIDLRVIVVDNASAPPIRATECAHNALFLRLPRNTGGSGGFNAGMSAWFDLESTGGADDLVWLVDSDARVKPGTLRSLVEALLDDATIAAVGPALADPDTWEVHEIGGVVDRRSGRLRAMHESLEDIQGFRSENPARDARTLIDCDYIAACCALVRRSAIETVGLMPDRFLNADDAEWFIRIQKSTGLRVCVLPGAVAAHPRFDRFPTFARFFGARNALAPLAALGLPVRVRLRRALQEVAKAVNMAMMDRDDLAELHRAGLAEALGRRSLGSAPPAVRAPLPMTPGDMLGGVLQQLARKPGGQSKIWFHPRIAERPHEFGWALGAINEGGVRANGRASDNAAQEADVGLRGARLVLGVVLGIGRSFLPLSDRVAIVPATGKPDAWLKGCTQISVAHDSFTVRSPRGIPRLLSAARVGLRSAWIALRLAFQPATPDVLPRRVAGLHAFLDAHAAPDRARCPLSVVVLSYNRCESLRSTLRGLRGAAPTDRAEILVVDNASTDGSTIMVRAEFPSVRLIALDQNSAVAGFNVGVAAARGRLVLVLDDDASPEPSGLVAAISAMDTDQSLAAVPLHPRHPRTGISEWPFAHSDRAKALARTHSWPVMGCGNLVKRDAWLAVGGYDDTFFLYRNDVDLAMKLLAANWRVGFNPDWVVWHDSPAVARKSARWFELATRNWFWLAQRHAGPLTSRAGLLARFGVLLGWAWAHRLAGLNPRLQFKTAYGMMRALRRPPPQLVPECRPDGIALANYISLQLSARGVRGRTDNLTRTSPVPTPTDAPSVSRPGVWPAEVDLPVVVTSVRSATTAASSDRHSA